MTSFYFLIPCFMTLALVGSIGRAAGEGLTTVFYTKSCPKVFSTVKPIIESAIEKDARNGACLLRLFFHDCFVNGCDASVLLDDLPPFIGEKSVPPNKNSACGFEIIDEVKSAVEKECPASVSCADIVAIAARDSVGILGGPKWEVQVGRLDARVTNPMVPNISIPGEQSSLFELTMRFMALGLNQRDLVALLGAHTLGQAKCHKFRERIYNESNIDKEFAEELKAICPRSPSGNANLAPLDHETPNKFDNSYYKELIEMKGLLHADQELFNRGQTDPIVKTYSESQETFFMDFVTAMIKLGSINPLVAPFGEIRLNCRKVNSILPQPPQTRDR